MKCRGHLIRAILLVYKFRKAHAHKVVNKLVHYLLVGGLLSVEFLRLLAQIHIKGHVLKNCGGTELRAGRKTDVECFQEVENVDPLGKALQLLLNGYPRLIGT